MQSLSPLGISFLMAFGAVLRSGKSSGLNKIATRNLGISGRRYIVLAKAEIVAFANVARVIFASTVLVRLRFWCVVRVAIVFRG
jgi:hypothetical protein